MPLPAPSLREPVGFPAPLPFLVNNNTSSYPDPQLLSFSLTFPFSGTGGISLLLARGWGARLSALGVAAGQARVMSVGDGGSLALRVSPGLGHFLGEVDTSAPCSCRRQ